MALIVCYGVENLEFAGEYPGEFAVCSGLFVAADLHPNAGNRRAVFVNHRAGDEFTFALNKFIIILSRFSVAIYFRLLRVAGKIAHMRAFGHVYVKVTGVESRIVYPDLA